MNEKVTGCLRRHCIIYQGEDISAVVNISAFPCILRLLAELDPLKEGREKSLVLVVMVGRIFIGEAFGCPSKSAQRKHLLSHMERCQEAVIM